MATSASTKKTKAVDLSDLLQSAARRSVTPATQTAEKKAVSQADAKFTGIEANPFHKIMWDPNLAPEQKLEETAKLLTFAADQSKEENKARLAELEIFKEWLQYQRKEMSQKLISLTDTEAFSELKQVYEEINNALLDFDNRMQPLTDIVDAIFELRMQGGDVIFDMFKEIKDDRLEEERRKQVKDDQETRLKELNDRLEGYNRRIAELSEEKSFWGLGGVKKSARQEISQIQMVDTVSTQAEIESLTREIENTNAEFSAPRESKYSDLATQKAKLKELLDISTDEHKERQKALVAAANTFVDTTEDRVNSVLKHLEGRNVHIDNIGEMNDGMEGIYAVLREAEKKAEKNNQDLRSTLQAPGEGTEESALVKMQREKKLRAVEEHITSLDTTSTDTSTTLGELSNASFQIKSMKDGNLQQVAKTRSIQSSGVAGVAQRLATTLDALSGAALNEASEMTGMSVTMMNDKTNRTIAKDALRRAAGIQDTNDSLQKAVNDLAAMGEVIRKASDMTREGVRGVKEKLGDLETVTKQIQDDVNHSYGVNADVGAEAAGKEEKKVAANSNRKPGSNSGGGFGGLNL